MNVLVNIDVADLDAALRFYRDGLGLEPARRFGDAAIELRAGSTMVYLLKKHEGSSPYPDAGSARTFARHWTPVHLDVVTSSIGPAVARALAAGARLESPIDDHAWGRIAGLSDPFGNGFCILEFTEAGYDAIAT